MQLTSTWILPQAAAQAVDPEEIRIYSLSSRGAGTTAIAASMYPVPPPAHYRPVRFQCTHVAQEAIHPPLSGVDTHDHMRTWRGMLRNRGVDYRAMMQ